MAIREIRYNVTSLGITPSTHQWGGVQNEDNATTVIYFIGNEYLKELGSVDNLRFRIDFHSASAGYEPSTNLTLTEANTVMRNIPKRITQFGGQVQAVLVISRLADGEAIEEILQIPSTIFFTSANRQDERFIKNLSAYEEYVAEKATEAGEAAEESKGHATNASISETSAFNYSVQAENQVKLIEEKLASGEFKGEKGEKGEKGDKGDSYILNESDKDEIADIVQKMFVDVSEVGR
jgi:hypothetical protein